MRFVMMISQTELHISYSKNKNKILLKRKYAQVCFSILNEAINNECAL